MVERREEPQQYRQRHREPGLRRVGRLLAPAAIRALLDQLHVVVTERPEVVTKMIKVFGAPVSEADAKAIREYLAQTYGK